MNRATREPGLSYFRMRSRYTSLAIVSIVVPISCVGGTDSVGAVWARLYLAGLVFFERSDIGSKEGVGMADRCESAGVDFELPDADGVVHRLNEYRGNWLLLVFHRHLG